jgi:hypothetical protein
MIDIIDMDSGTKLQHVVNVNPDTGEVVCAHWPLRMKLGNGFGDPEMDTYTIKFRSIYPIYAGRFQPYLVHCYGRKLSCTEMVAPLVKLLTGRQ